jgi:CIC family chloride channel protein
LGLSLLAVLVGLITGLGAVFFRALIALIHNVAFLGQLSTGFDANQFTPPSPWGPFIILVPVIGGLIVTFLVVNFAPEARGHGVPEVLDAIYYKEGKIRPVVAAIKSRASLSRLAPAPLLDAKAPSSKSVQLSAPPSAN